MRYQAENEHCRASGFIHVGSEVDLETGMKANRATLMATIQNLKQD